MYCVAALQLFLRVFLTDVILEFTILKSHSIRGRISPRTMATSTVPKEGAIQYTSE